jgi:hypothetical protein
MTRKTEEPILVQLYNNKKLATKVNYALDNGMTYDEIIDLCREYDFEISKSAISRYNSKRKEAMETGVPLKDLIDKRRKTGNVIDLVPKREKATTKDGEIIEEYNAPLDSVGKLYNDLELLDDIVAKGFAGLQYVDIVELPLAMKAIEIKNKITGNQLQGLSMAGLRELNLRRIAKESAMTEVLLQYVPADQHEEVLQAMDEKEKEFYDTLDLTEEDRKITTALKSAGLEL